MLKNSMFMIISDRRRFSVKNPGGFCGTWPNVESTNIHALSPEKAANESKIPVTEQPVQRFGDGDSLGTRHEGLPP